MRDNLPCVTVGQINHALKQHQKLVALTNKAQHHCLSCGHSWKQQKVQKPTCPSCNVTGAYSKHYTNGRARDSFYYAIITTKDRFQIIRMFLSRMDYKRGEKPTHFLNEVMQHYICTKTGYMYSLQKPVQGLSAYYDLWQTGELEFRTPSYNHHTRNQIAAWKIFPKMGIHPIIKRNGFDGKFHHTSPQYIFQNLLNNKFETLWKLGQYKLANHIVNHHENYYDQYIICLRHKYEIFDLNTYNDYIRLLIYFDKDITNPAIICPADLHEAHNLYVKRKRKILKAQELAELKSQIDSYEPDYEQHIKAFKNIQFADGDLTIQPLKTVMEFWLESEALHHCVFTNEYYAKPSSLILSAQKAGERLETIEIDLRKLKVVQAHGLQNKPSKAHRKILQLVKGNLHQIANCI